MNNIKVSCVGNITDDLLLQVDDFPVLDDVAYVNKSVRCMGGRGAIVALILGRASIPTGLLTTMPDISRSYEFIDFLNQNNVCTDGVNISKSAQSLFEAIIAISKQQRNCISFFKPTEILFEVSETQKQFIRNSDIVYFSTHKRAFNKTLLIEASLSSCSIVHNVSSYFLQDKEYIDLMLQKCNVFICNELEAKAFLDTIKIKEIPELFNMAPELDRIFVTKGEDGSFVYEKEGRCLQIEAKPATAVSPVGAGDAYSAGILYGIAQKWSSAHCAKFASELASISVESNETYPDLERLDKLINEFGGKNI